MIAKGLDLGKGAHLTNTIPCRKARFQVLLYVSVFIKLSTKQSGKRVRRVPKAVLRIPDLDQAKSAVLNSLNSKDAQRGYRHAIDEFIDWYCSEPRLSFSRSVVLRYRIHLESRRLAPGTINFRLGVVRRLAYEASDCGLLSPDLAAGIRLADAGTVESAMACTR